jgi:hypothetical protein
MSAASVGIASANAVSPRGDGVDCGGCGGGGGSGGGGGDIARLRLNGTCGDQLDMRLRQVGDPLDIGITIPSADPSEVWTITVTEQNYGVVTGGRVGNPIDLIGSGTLPPPTFNSAEGGFSTEGNVPNTSDVTHGFSYVATRTSPTPITCTNTGYWTTPSGSEGPTTQNPSGKPDTAPALTGATEADAGANDVALQFDQEMLTTAQGTPDTSRFSVTVDGVARTVTGVSITDDSPPLQAIADITFDGAPLITGQTVAVLYRQPLTSGTPALQDMDSLPTASFGPLSIPVF